MSGTALFVLLLVVTNGLFGATVAAAFLRFNDRLGLPAWPLVLAGLGLGPFGVSLVLYYALALWHGIPDAVLLALPLLGFAGLAWSAGKGWGQLAVLMKRIPPLLGDRSMWFFFLGSAFIACITFVFLANKPLIDHDVLEYAIQGGIFLRDHAITYQKHHFDATSGFYYVGLHGFAFPLLFTWEGLVGGMFELRSDLWVRSITMWYGWLLIAFVWSLLRRWDRWMAVAGGIALTVPIGFLFLITVYHLDSFRIFFFTVAFAAFIALLQRPSRERLVLFALLCGAQTFIHSIGAILGGLLLALALVLLSVPTHTRARWGALAAGIMLLMGGVHYVADVFLGTGWIFQDLIWF